MRESFIVVEHQNCCQYQTFQFTGQPHDNNRRELRRPMGGDEELARGIGRMDPFGYGGQYGGGNGRYGMQNQFEPPRPAPNADGWSSGDDYLTWNDQQQHHQQQQHQHQPREDHFGQNSHQNQYRTPAQSRLHYNQQQYQQRQQQQQQQWGIAQPQWNIGASEFVPK